MTDSNGYVEKPKKRTFVSRRWVFPLAAVTVGLVLTEILCRAFFTSPFVGRTIATGMLHHPRWGAIHEPGVSYRSQNPADKTDFGMAINTLGFRSPELREPKVNTSRIVFVGDSFTEGYGVEWTEGLVAQAEQQFLASNPDIRIEVINAGIRGGAPSTYRRQLDRILALDPDAIVLVVYDNDLADDFYYSVDWDHLRADVYQWIYRLPFESRLVELLGELVVRARHHAAVARAESLVGGTTLRSETPVYGSGKIEEDPVGFYVRPDLWEPLWSQSQKFLDEIAERTQSHDVDLAIVYIPCPQTGIHNDCCQDLYPAPEGMQAGEYSPFGNWLSEFSRERDIPFIDVRETLVELGRGGDPEKVYEISNGHLNARGNRVVANLVQETLRGWALR